MIKFLMAIIAAYIIGSVPNAYLVGKGLRGVDLRKVGSGNPGAANAFRVLGKGYGVLILMLDVLKGFIPAMFFAEWFNLKASSSLHSLDISLIVGLVAVSGHVFSVFLKFRGGKGVATSIGVFLAIAPLPLLITLALALPIVIITRYVSLGSLSGAVLLPITIKFLPPETKILFYLTLGLALLVFYLHRQNIKRLIKGKESRLF